MGMGDGDGERVGGVRAVGRRARQQAFHHRPDLALVAVTGADHRLLHLILARIRRLSPSKAGASIAIPRAWPSFNVAEPSRLTKVSSTAASSGEPRQHL
jgi:hypothetical protein